MSPAVYRTELTPTSFLRRNAFVFPDRTAVIHDHLRYTYQELNRRVNRFASSLLAAGLEKHDRVAVLAPNTPPLLEAHFAVPLARGTLVAINTRLHRNEIAYILQDCGAKFLFVDKTLLPLVTEQSKSAMRVIRIDDTGQRGDPYEDFLARGAEDLEACLEDENEPLSMNYTSGTTGHPKGVVYSHRGAYLNALGTVIQLGLSAESVFLWTLPMFHCNGWCFTWGRNGGEWCSCLPEAG